ncbi:MAG: phage tail sheath family protein [Lachnospiraceae bacterium]|nr:phage tail sheath family protein [Lachnospiraceae bacterium]
MAYGGGIFISQNKVLPGAYINFVSTATASATLSDRGTVAMPLELDWGPDGEVFEVTQEDFQKNSLKIFGYAYSADEMQGLRDLFLNCQTLYAYKLTSGGDKASNDYATALYGGTRGNDLKIVIQANVDDESMYDVTTLMGTATVDEQTVASAADLVNNDYVAFDTDATLELPAGTPLSGGTNAEVDGTAWQAFIDKAEQYTFNIAAAVTTDDTIKSLFATWVERMRDEMGVKFQVVLYDYTEADYLGVISVKNPVTDDGWNEASLVYWVAGLEANCAVNKSCQNSVYNGEFTVSADYTQSELKAAISAGEFVLHRVGSDIRVLDDINTLVTLTDDCGEVFQSNQTIRVIDQIANDVATLFVEKYLGLVPNDAAGRISLWYDIVKIHNELLDMRAIEDFTDSDITVEQGDSKKSVVVTDAITIVNAMSKLYMTVTVN